MKKIKTLSLLIFFSLVVAALLQGQAQAASLPQGETGGDRVWRKYLVRYLHVSTSHNTIGAVSYLDHALLNNNPDAIFFVTQNLNAGGGFSATLNEHHIGVWYHSAAGYWAIVNQDSASMPIGSDYNIFIPDYTSDRIFVHTASGANSSGNSTFIDNPLANGNPDALVFVTQAVNPGGGTEYTNDHAVGVWYSNADEQWLIFNEDGATMQANRSFFVMVEPANPTLNRSFVHTAEASTILGGSTFTDHPEINHDPHALIMVTQIWNPGGSGGVYNDYAFATTYNPLEDKWAIVNLAPGSAPDMTQNASFNVMILPGEDDFSLHTSRASNISGFTTEWDSQINYLSNSLALFTRKSYRGSSLFLSQPLGIQHGFSDGFWKIFYQDLATPFPENAQFNLLIPNMDAGVFIHKAHNNNTFLNSTFIEHPLTDNIEEAIVFVTQVYNPGGTPTGIPNDHVVGVWYDGSEEKWAVFNQDLAYMPLGAAFNIFIPLPGPNVFVHDANAGNTDGSVTYISNLGLNNNPYASVLVTQNWNPGGTGGVYNPSPIYTAYDPVKEQWLIGNENGTAIPDGASFNVYLQLTPIQSFIPLFSY